MSEPIKDSGACHCRSIKYNVSGNIVLNTYCHCKACAHNRAMSPVHLICVTPFKYGVQAEAIEIIEGEKFLQTTKGYGKMVHTFCAKCGCMIYEYKEGANFRAIPPTNFHIEDGACCKLPEKYMPKSHINYENRQYDWHDQLPKFKAFPPEGLVDNQGHDLTDPS